MKKVTLKNLDAYRLSTEEKKQVIGGWWYDGPCVDCAPGWVKISDGCQYVECRRCSELPSNYPGCEMPDEGPIDSTDPIDCCTEFVG